MPDRDISVVICAYTEDRWEQIRGAVDSVRAQSLPGVELILVIDHNPALYQRAVLAMPDVTVVENVAAPGLSGARNTGAARAGGDIIAFLDDDTTAHEDWLKFLADCYEDPQIMGVGGMTLPRWQTRRPSWLPEEFDWVVGCNYTGMGTVGTKVRNLIGANMSFRREAFALVRGGFAEGTGRTAVGPPLGCEETEFCIKLHRAAPGSLLMLEHRAMIWHFVSDNRCTFSYFLTRCFAEGVSKARVTASVGSSDGLSAERYYTTRTLPPGVLRGLADVCRGDVAGLARAAAIIVGLSTATAGYLRAKLAGRLRGVRLESHVS